MTQDELFLFARRQPFVPFRLVLTTGAALEVRQRDQIMLGNTPVVVGVSDWPEGTAFDRTVLVDHVTITTAEFLV